MQIEIQKLLLCQPLKLRTIRLKDNQQNLLEIRVKHNFLETKFIYSGLVSKVGREKIPKSWGLDYLKKLEVLQTGTQMSPDFPNLPKIYPIFLSKGVQMKFSLHTYMADNQKFGTLEHYLIILSFLQKFFFGKMI